MDESDIPKEHTSMEDIPHCSTDMNAAWLIVGHMTKLPKTFLVASELRASRFALWWEKENLWAMSASDAANAICVESLHICGVEVVNG